MRSPLPFVLIALAACSRSFVSGRPEPTRATRPTASFGPSVAVLAAEGGVREGALAISPNDPRMQIAAGIHFLSDGTFQVEAWRSTDSGLHWSRAGALPATFGGATFRSTWDPVLAFDRAGVAYLTTIGGDTSDRWHALIFRSTDGGLTWTGNDVTPGAAKLDKEWIAVDNSGSAFDGSIYMVWETFLTGPPALHIARSRDGGATWKEVPAIASNGAPFVAVSGDGTVYAVHYGKSGTQQFEVLRSDDGGVSFQVASSFGSMLFGTRPGVGAAATSFPQIAGDVTNTATRGNLYAIYPSTEGTWGAFFSKSTDRGATWSTPKRLSPVATDIALPSITTDTVSGDIVVSWLDGRNASGEANAQVWSVRSSDGGATFDAGTALTGAFAITGHTGDYNQIASVRGVAGAVFSDTAGTLAVAQMSQHLPDLSQRRRSVRH